MGDFTQIKGENGLDRAGVCMVWAMANESRCQTFSND